MAAALEFEVGCLKPEDGCIENESNICHIVPLCEKYRVRFYISKENRVQHPLLLSAFHTETLLLACVFPTWFDD